MNCFLEPLALENSVFDLEIDEAQKFSERMQTTTDHILRDTSAAFLREKSTTETRKRLDEHFQETEDLCTKLFLRYASTSKESSECTVARRQEMAREISSSDATHFSSCEQSEKHIIVPFQDNDGVWRGYLGTVLDRIDGYRFRVECEDGDAAIVTIDLINRMEISGLEFTQRKKEANDGFILPKGDIPIDGDILPVLIP